MRRNQKHRKKARRGAARSSQDKFRNGQSEIQCILIRIVVDRKTFYSFFNELYGHSHSFIVSSHVCLYIYIIHILHFDFLRKHNCFRIFFTREFSVSWPSLFTNDRINA